MTDRTQQLENEIDGLYEQFSDSNEEKQAILNAAALAIKDLDNLIKTHGEETFLEVSSLNLERQVNSFI